MDIFKSLPEVNEMESLAAGYSLSPALNVNAHFHSPYSYSSFDDIAEVFNLAEKDQVDVLGINDFLTTAGYEEFGEMALKCRRFPLFNIEFMGLIPEAQQNGIRINDPNNPGRIYFCGKGLMRSKNLSGENKKILKRVFDESLYQVRDMVLKLNHQLKNIHAPFTLEFESIQKKYTKGLVRERHIIKALRIECSRHFKTEPENKEFLSRLYNNGKPMAPLSDIPALENEMRSRLLKKGGVAFVEENESAFLSIDAMRSIILNAGGIPCYPVLLDDDKVNFTEFEKNYEELYRQLMDYKVFAIELIPRRNKLSVLKDFVDYFNRRGFLVTLGTEHNTSEKFSLAVDCRGGEPLPESLKIINYESACILAAHQYLLSKNEAGYLTDSGDPRLDRKERFIRLGNAVIRRFTGR